jgi:hypothetical protein
MILDFVWSYAPKLASAGRSSILHRALYGGGWFVRIYTHAESGMGEGKISWKHLHITSETACPERETEGLVPDCA